MCLESFEPGAPPGKVHRIDNLQANKDKLGMVCFLIGSLLFTVDGIGYCVVQLTWHGLVYTLSSALFVVGSGLMLL